MTDLDKCLFFVFVFFATYYVVRIFVMFNIKTNWFEYVCKVHVQAITSLDKKGNINSWDSEDYDCDYYLLPSSLSLLLNPKHWLKFRIKQFKEFEEFNEKMCLLVEKGDVTWKKKDR